MERYSLSVNKYLIAVTVCLSNAGIVPQVERYSLSVNKHLIAVTVCLSNADIVPQSERYSLLLNIAIYINSPNHWGLQELL